MTSKTRTLPDVLRSGRQADPDGVEVRISRQAVEEAASEIERLSQRCKEHEQFRHQHRDCDRMGVALQQIGLLVKDAQSSVETKASPNVLKHVTSEWDTTKNDVEVTTHHRMVEGVLCRWWGDGPTPDGVALIDRAVALMHSSVETAGDAIYENMDELVRDAARYRWIRKNAQHSVCIEYTDETGADRSSTWGQIPEALDDVVDKALAKPAVEISPENGTADPQP